MNAVLISIQPKWCELIASGKKMVEVRKTKPKIETPFKCYIYCTSSNVHECLMWNEGGVKLIYACNYKTAIPCGGYIANGKVIGEFVCNKFTYIEAGYDTNGNKHLYNTAFIEHRMCIPDNELHEYLYKSRENCSGWAWHISDLVIYDKPKELREFKIVGCKGCRDKDTYHCKFHCRGERRITRPPQSYMYVEELR